MCYLAQFSPLVHQVVWCIGHGVVQAEDGLDDVVSHCGEVVETVDHRRHLHVDQALFPTTATSLL